MSTAILYVAVPMIILTAAQLLHRMMDQRQMMIERGIYLPRRASKDQVRRALGKLPNLDSLTDSQATSIAELFVNELDRRRRSDRLFAVALSLISFVAGGVLDRVVAWFEGA
jgi:hypothetical protein